MVWQQQPTCGSDLWSTLADLSRKTAQILSNHPRIAEKHKPHTSRCRKPLDKAGVLFRDARPAKSAKHLLVSPTTSSLEQHAPDDLSHRSTVSYQPAQSGTC